MGVLNIILKVKNLVDSSGDNTKETRVATRAIVSVLKQGRTQAEYM